MVRYKKKNPYRMQRGGSAPRLSNSQVKLLATLEKSSNSARKDMLKNGDEKLVKTLIECVKILINSRNKLSDAQFSALRRRSEDIQRIISPTVSLAKKKTVLQKGGFLPLLLGLPIIKTLAGSILGGLFKK